MSINTFIVDYVSECVKNNLNPLDKAKQELADIEKQIKETDKLLLKRRKILAVLDYCGYKTLGKNKDENIVPDLIDDSDKSLELQKKIKEQLTLAPKSVRELMNEIGSYEDGTDAMIIRTIKLMGSKGIIARNNSTQQYFLTEN